MTIRIPLLLLGILVFGVAVPQPVAACSFTYAPGYSPNDIKRRGDVWRVTGQFRFVDGKTGEIVPDDTTEFWLTEDTGEALGLIERNDKKPVLTRQYYSEISIECGAYLAPTGNFAGKFWIERKKDKSGRHRLLMWEPND